MRVLHLGKYYPPFAGGMEHFLADLLPALERLGVTGAALVHAHDGPGCAPAPGDAPAIWRAPAYGRLLYAPVSPAFPLWLHRVIRGFRPDLLHLHLPNTSAFWALLLPAARRLPWVVHWHADVVASRVDRRLALAYGLYRPWEQRLLARSRAILTTSPPYLDYSDALRPWRSRCHIVPLGLAPERIRPPTPEALRQADDLWGNTPFRLLAVGRLTYYKGYPVLLQALARLGGNSRLLIVGEGEQRPHLEALIAELGLTARVRLLGFRRDTELNALFATCHLLCLPSLERTEAFGLVLLEAMYFGKPVLSCDIPGSGTGWVVRQGGHGLTVPPGDVAALERALRDLERDPERRRSLGRAGAQALGRRFHIDPVAAQVRGIYRQVLAGP